MDAPKVKHLKPGYAWGYTPANEMFRYTVTQKTNNGSAMQGYLANQARLEQLLDWSLSL